ncbi:MAG: 3'-5' exonuclease [Proteobacteria bacterium]|nr:MAG: 3'-5' exonuclease [Pseudomonadota bacterium]
MTPVLAFDIETIPDTDGLRRVYGLPETMSDADVADLAFRRRRQATGSDFLPLHLQRVAAIACALRERNGFTVWSLGDANAGEADLLQRFFDGVQKYTPQLVSWNGGGFDLPVLHYRALVHGVAASRYWDLGDDDREFKWNNYIGRYHTRHLDLMDLLSLYQPRASVPLDELARLLGFPGKLGMDGSKVWEAFRRGELEDIRNYCETDAVNTYLVFLRFQLMRGALDAANYERELNLVRDTLERSIAPHWREFIDAWRHFASATPVGQSFLL